MHQRTQQRRGNAIIVGLSLFALIGFATMAVDVGFAETNREELQAAIDASALAAVGELDGSTSGMNRAVQMAKNLAANNTVMNAPLVLADADIELGSYEAGVFTTTSDATIANAVRITRSNEPVMPFFSMAAFGESIELNLDATAHRQWNYGGASSVDCFLPVAVPDCYYTEGTVTFMKFQFGNDSEDNIAWADENNANANNVRDQLEGQCTGSSISVGDPLQVNNGQLNTALKEVTDILENKGTIAPDAWDTTLWGAVPSRDGVSANVSGDSSVGSSYFGNVLQGPIALVDAGDCDGTKFTGEFTITGFAWGAIYDTRENSSGGVKQNMWMLMDTMENDDYGTWGEYDPDALGNVKTLSPPQLIH